jgi:hypothetical protein
VGLLVGSTPLQRECAVTVIYFLIIALIIRQALPAAPVDGDPLQLRAIAGRETKAGILLKTKPKVSGMLFLASPYPWFKASHYDHTAAGRPSRGQTGCLRDRPLGLVPGQI